MQEGSAAFLVVMACSSPKARLRAEPTAGRLSRTTAGSFLHASAPLVNALCVCPGCTACGFVIDRLDRARFRNNDPTNAGSHRRRLSLARLHVGERAEPAADDSPDRGSRGRRGWCVGLCSRIPCRGLSQGTACCQAGGPRSGWSSDCHSVYCNQTGAKGTASVTCAREICANSWHAQHTPPRSVPGNDQCKLACCYCRGGSRRYGPGQAGCSVRW